MGLFSKMFGGAAVPKPTYHTEPAYVGLRKQILALRPDQLGVPGDTPILAVLVEMSRPDAVVTLVAVVDGAASLYFSNGGGIIGAGGNPGPNAAARQLVAKAAEFQSVCALTKEFPLPARARVRFYLVTPQGVLAAEAMEEDLGNRLHPHSPLFFAAHELITQIQLSEEKGEGAAGGEDEQNQPERPR